MSDQEKRIQEIASIFRHCARIASGCSHAYIAPETLIEAADLIESTRSDWTPCAEGLPKKVDKRLWSRDVLATIKQKTGNCFVVVAYYHYGHEQWKTDDMTDNDAIDVLAWQPLPEPYNPDRKEDAK